MDIQSLIFCLIAYLCGSILFSHLYSVLFHTSDPSGLAEDHNPGAANAFHYGGWKAGIFTIIGDIGKGILPVSLYLHMVPDAADSWWLAAVMIMPVLGHLFSVFYHFRGGKGIAVSFGVLLGLVPQWAPVLLLAFFFLLFTVLIPIKPNFVKTVIVYWFFAGFSLLLPVSPAVHAGSLLIALVIEFKLSFIVPEWQKVKVVPLWKR